jgi:hypothetical protein
MPSVNVFNCNLAPREQLNIQTSWLDLDQLYGYYPDLAKSLRGENGTLKVSLYYGKEYLPFASNTPTCSYSRSASEYSRKPK